MKKLLLLFNIVFFGLVLTVFLIDRDVKNSTASQLYSEVEEVPYHKVGLLLGTAKYAVGGRLNLYYKYRIRAAVALFHAKKISYVLVSGDNGTKHYDEPTKMKKDLIEAGIPEDRIVLDYAGFRTLDSVVRAKEVFQLEDYTVISQEFHNQRALYLANHFEHNAVGFNAKGVSYRYGFKVVVREYLARVKMMLDLIIGVEPKFLGEKVLIGG